MRARWLVVLVAATTLVVTPVALAARPASGSNVSALELAHRIQSSGDVPWSGFVESSGRLNVPDSASFANLAQLLGDSSQLRVWWRNGHDWRVDRVRSTGEADLYREGDNSVRWVFESETATISPASKVRLPDSSDLLPATFARSVLHGVRDDELVRLPARRVAGVDAPGLRLTPDEPTTTVGHIDLWADPESGLPLRAELYGVGDQHPVLTTSVTELDLGPVAPAATKFVPGEDVDITYDESVDVAAAANAFAPYDLPPSLAGLGARSGEDPGAVGIYGRGPTILIAVPLRAQVADPLRDRLESTGTSRKTAVGLVAPVGPVGLLVTPRHFHGGGHEGFLLAGTVTTETLERAAAELLKTQ